jgi:hypothetical protein
MEYAVAYWERPGKHNTDGTIELAFKRARKSGIKYGVVATCSGRTARRVLARTRGIKIIAVTHQSGFSGPGKMEMDKRTANYLKKRGVAVYTGTHFLGGFGRAIRLKFGGLEPEEIAANTLRIFGQGVKVCVEIAIMALDAGLVPYGKEVVAIGGTGEGADTAIICVPKHGKDFFSFEVREIICKPRRI